MNVGKVGAPVQAVAPKKMTLADVRSGVISAPQRLLVYGTEGSGKSTFAAGAPKAIFLGAEGGTLYLDVARLPEPRTWQDVLDGLALVEHDAHVYETLVVDPLNWLEALCWHAVTGGKGAIDQKPFDYGRGYTAALNLWRVMLATVERIWTTRKMHILFLAHAEVKRFENPMGEAWNHYVPNMNEKASSLFKRWVDHVLFLQVEAVARKNDEDKRIIGRGTGSRIAHACPSAAFDAKGRNLPPELVLPAVGGWDVFFEAVKKGQQVSK